ncbi:MAG: hypothetical protein A2487_00285 [Candidatus Raymondbacteria bacterium RifOxyC12_full_50_8]|uniref:Uncharacterized protein n=1 Tax=Candidatus Raymondbacteria bacterium RIFOXYD12_FULL_49_13 TaxID=1817890 RepID=A0A1F7FLN7_UNCRA|nr:MAG: hypothetical protein A2248_08795 [Candidatus Raymondbacteria bacterium RIFOXYA2_FULL_49_16]OGK07491.1 MAG: hypothetical protein A2519_20240 [Candidatus Raymondbacteria bacterium RIFOXYD12_FULL_49_13]OGK07776.1 MAG: hypothetical protein A2487_00285 [Candidatus Raymondbacteria bacterium RifOxyC12_full_50_8]OGP43847.1 MAG: hypothetical protein A2324_01470 [Candidatus Raymondbacteria bacterium RIFOXYB2_FULL_49_35]
MHAISTPVVSAGKVEQFCFKVSASGSATTSPTGIFDSLLNSLWNSEDQKTDPLSESVQNPVQASSFSLMEMVKSMAQKAVDVMESLCSSLGIGGPGMYGASFTAECSSFQKAVVFPENDQKTDDSVSALSDNPQFVQSMYMVRVQCTLVQCLDASPSFQKAFAENPNAVMEDFTRRLDELQTNFLTNVKMGKVISAEPGDIGTLVEELDKKYGSPRGKGGHTDDLKTDDTKTLREELIENDREYLEKRRKRQYEERIQEAVNSV